MRTYIERLFITIYFLSLSILIILKTGTDGIINLGDTFFPFLPSEALKKYIFFSWVENNLGTSSVISYSTLPLYLYRAILDSVGIPLWINNRIYFFIPLFMIGTSMYYLSSFFIEGKFKKISAIISSTFVMINPFTMSALHGGSIPMLFSYSMIILIFGLYLKGINSKKIFNKYLVLIGIFSPILFSDFIIGSLIIIPIALYSIYYSVLNKSNIKKIIYCLKFTSLTFGIIFLLNLWWILPFIMYLLDNGAQLIYQDNSAIEVLNYTKPYTSFIWILRFLYGGMVTGTANYVPYYISPAGILIGFSIILLSFSTLLYNTRKNHTTYLMILMLISIVLSSGISTPFFSSIYLWFWNNLSLFHAFRNPLKFSYLYLMSMSLLLGMSVQNILFNIENNSKIHTKNYIKNIFLSAVIILILVNGWPLLTGNLAGHLMPINIPDDYFKVHDYLTENNIDSRVLILPLQTWYTKYQWSPYNMQDVVFTILPNPMVMNYPGQKPHGFLAQFYNETSNFSKLFAISDIKFILVHKDIDNSEFKNTFELSPFIVQKMKCNNLDLYEISDTYTLPHVYTTSTQLVIPNIESLNHTIESDDFVPYKQSIIVQNQNQNKTIPLIKSNTMPHIYFKKFNPTKYEVIIENANEPFYLVLSESYNKGWQAYINREQLSCNSIQEYKNSNVTKCQSENNYFELRDLTGIFSKSISETNHFVANGFANAWYIDPSELEDNKNFSITLYFKPQSYFQIGVILSLIILFSLFIMYKKLSK